MISTMQLEASVAEIQGRAKSQHYANQMTIPANATSVLVSEFSDTVYFMDGLLEIGHWSPLFGYSPLSRVWSIDIATDYTRIQL